MTHASLGPMKQILTAAAAKLLDVTPAAVRAMEKRGDLPAERTSNNTRLFDRSVVQRVAKQRAVAGRARD